MIRSFRDQATKDLFNGHPTKAARQRLPAPLWRRAARKLDQLDQAAALGDLSVPPGNRLEALKGDRVGQHSIRINDQYRVCFRWETGYAYDVEITDYH